MEELTKSTSFPVSLILGGTKLTAAPAGTQPLAGGLLLRMTQTGEENGCLYRRMELENTGNADSAQITCPRIVDAEIPCASSAVLHTLRGDNCSRDSFMPVEKTFAVGDTHVMAPTGGRPSNTSAFPFFDLTVDGRAYYFAVGWSGQWMCEIVRTEAAVTIRIGMQTADFYLKPGERVSLPSVFMTEDDSAAAVRRRAKQLFFRYFNALDGTVGTLPLSIQPFDRYYYGRCPEWPTEHGQLVSLDHAVQCEYLDTFWFDAGWFNLGFDKGVGNYSFAPGFPNGLKPIADAVHKAGMRYMIWFEPERVHAGTDVYEQHRDFLLSANGNEEWFLYDLGREDAYVWLRDKLIGFVRENGIDDFRQDFNIDPLPYWCEHDEPGRQGITEIRYITNLYRLWDEMKAAIPGLFIDNCSSGGRRIDFETMRRAAPMWRSDIACGPITETKHNDVYDQNQTLCLGEYLPYHACAAWELVANDIRSAATAGLACTFDILKDDYDFTRAKLLLSEVKRFSAYWDGDFYPLTAPTLEENCFAAYELNKGGEGVALIYRRAACEDDTFRFVPQGIDRDAAYLILTTDEDMKVTAVTVSGKKFAEGISVRLPKAHTSAAVEFRRAGI